MSTINFKEIFDTAKSVYNSLGQDDTVLKIAFITALVHLLKCSSVLDYPLSNTFCGIILAVVYTAIVKLCLYILPNIFKPILSIIFITSIIYYLVFKECYDNMEPKFEYVTKDGVNHIRIGYFPKS